MSAHTARTFTVTIQFDVVTFNEKPDLMMEQLEKAVPQLLNIVGACKDHAVSFATYSAQPKSDGREP